MLSPNTRGRFLEWAAKRLRMPIGADLVLHERPDASEIVLDGRRLGQVIEEAARRYATPLAVPLMNLRLEKADLLRILGVPEAEADAFRFHAPPSEKWLERARSAAGAGFAALNQAHFDSIRYIAQETGRMPIGMAIGPFSLSTKLMADPITPLALAGRGLTAGDDPGVDAAERCLALAEMAVHRSLRAQIASGAKAVVVCEPAAGRFYISPRQMEAGSDVFERFVMQPALRLKRLLEDAGTELIFHDCGELTVGMVRQFGERLHPVMLSLGSSRKLWEDAAVVPKDVVLYGNLPTRNFYSDAAAPLDAVAGMAEGLIARMDAAGHPFILGSECDVLHVPEAAETIRRKVERMLAR